MVSLSRGRPLRTSRLSVSVVMTGMPLVVVYTEYVELEDDGMVDVPDLTGMALVPANRALRSVGLVMEIKGSGVCVSQYPKAGERVPAGTEVEVRFD